MLKWPGGKRAILKELLPFAPKTFQRYYEPFIGSGAMFFVLAPAQATISDANEELINCYVQVRDHPHAIIGALAKMKNTREDYYKIRASTPEEPLIRAARLIYLMTLSFNGLYRVNQQGKFNVPYNHKIHLDPCDKAKILNASLALSNVQIMQSDFEQVVENADYGDFIYFDPPYTVSLNPSSFGKYNCTIFSWADHLRLAKTAQCLVARGCHVLISNADHPAIVELYQDLGFHKHSITRFSVIAANSRHRKYIAENLFYNRGEVYANERGISRKTS